MRREKLETVRRRIAYGGFASLLIGVALSLSQCTMVSDLTGVRLSQPLAPTSCAGLCRDAYRDAISAERKRHSTQNEFCRSLDEPDKSACLDAERALYDANVTVLRAQLDECLNNCHRQGGGSAG